MRKIRIIPETGLIVGNDFSNYATMPYHIFIKTFLPRDASYCIVGVKDKADICCYGVGLKDDSVLRDDELNVFISVENLAHWGAQENNNMGWSEPSLLFLSKI